MLASGVDVLGASNSNRDEECEERHEPATGHRRTMIAAESGVNA
jgi:hypothetical protein